MDLAAQAASVGALAEPTRLALYEYVVASGGPVGREEAASALGLAPHTANFHLDRLVEAGLLTTEYRRLGGRTGPGAGRPSKLYRRGEDQVEISLPDRKYDLVGHILATGIERAGEGGGPPAAAGMAAGVAVGAAVDEAAGEIGRAIGAEAAPGDVAAFTRILTDHGFEPRIDGEDVLLANCPFDALARRHTALVCGMNRSFVQGVADGMGCDVSARLAPEPGMCCVRGRIGPESVSRST